jgi:hypothetical protein
MSTPRLNLNSAPLSIAYSLEEHRHRFAAWAAARAAQRGFTSSEKLIAALEHCGVRAYLAAHVADEMDAGKFERLHHKWCRLIVAHLEQAGVLDVRWGRSAKLVAVYLKSMVIVGAGSNTDLARVAHPPVDSTLLQNLAGCKRWPSPHQKSWRTVKWTQLRENPYYELIRQLRSWLTPDEPFWALEQCWFPAKGGA